MAHVQSFNQLFFVRSTERSASITSTVFAVFTNLISIFVSLHKYFESRTKCLIGHLQPPMWNEKFEYFLFLFKLIVNLNIISEIDSFDSLFSFFFFAQKLETIKFIPDNLKGNWLNLLQVNFGIYLHVTFTLIITLIISFCLLHS
jgi:hypothetical protein